jgi:alpha-tubulin suppressor-like RCC1 family protein
LTTWEKVVGGQYGAMAKKTDGTLWVWGDNRQGQVGDGFSITFARSSPVQLGALTTWTDQFGTWGFNAAGAIKNDGTMWTWGGNSNGALGQNDRVSRSSPVQVGAETNWSQMTALYAEGFLALTTDGELYSWGNNNVAQLGQDDTVSRSSPTQVGTDTDWTKVFEKGQYTISSVKDKSYRKGMPS